MELFYKRYSIANMKSIGLILTVALSLGLSGCGAKGPMFTSFEKPMKQHSIIYIYRPFGLLGAARDVEVFDNSLNQHIGTLSNSGYLEYVTNKGKHIISLNQKFMGYLDPVVQAKYTENNYTQSITVDIDINELVCIRMNYFGSKAMELVDSKTCFKEIKETSLSSDN